ncbi:MAG: LacI family DNA-binding transcriptional regulator [Pirellulales bacterium]|nr:LacI family DNA-binding transcriptional regulator [Pirellulales bacterium]
MSRNPTSRVKMSDIAQRAKVSRMAVSHVLMGTGKGYIRVSEKTAQRIRAIARELGYTPNRAAQQLAGKRSGVLGILANDWMHPTELRILSWMHRLADQRGYRVLAAQANQSVESLKKYVADYAGRGIDGLIFVAFGNDALWPLLRGAFDILPRVVSVLGRPDFGQGYYVDTDHAEGIRQAVTHLHRQGRRRIVQVLEDPDSLMSRSRAEAFQQVCRELEIDDDPRRFSVTFQGATLRNPSYVGFVEELIGRLQADAIIANSDSSALGIIHALYYKGLRTPDDVGVVGWGNDVTMPFAVPNLTTINFRFEEIIATALDLLTAMMEDPGDKKLRSVVIPPELMVRQTA